MSKIFLPAARENRVETSKMRLNRIVGWSGGLGSEYHPYDPFYTSTLYHSSGLQAPRKIWALTGKEFIGACATAMEFVGKFKSASATYPGDGRWIRNEHVVLSQRSRFESTDRS